VRLRGSVRGRVGAIQRWLERRVDSKPGRLSLDWFRAYFEASQNSGSAAALYMFLSVAPTMLAVIGVLDAAGADTSAFADRLVAHLHLTGETAHVVKGTFGSASSNALAASLAAVVGFLIWGLGIGQIYQDVYARAWKIQVRTLSDQGRFAVWFFAVSGLLGLGIASSGQLRAVGWIALIPLWLAGSLAFWLWTPSYLLHRQIGLRQLVPGALLATIVIGGASATSPLFLGGWLKTDAKYFGSFGVVLALLSWAFILVTLSMVCAIFSPVWSEWRAAERRRPAELASAASRPAADQAGP
jgi:membrane protein